MKSFIILFSENVGSSWLCDLLNSHPQLHRIPAEPLADHRIPNLLSEGSLSNFLNANRYSQKLLQKINSIYKNKYRNKLAYLLLQNPSVCSLVESENYILNAADLQNKPNCQYLFFKARYYELTTTIKQNLIVNHQIPLIYLKRENKIKHAVSIIKRREMNLGHFQYKKILPPVVIAPKKSCQ